MCECVHCDRVALSKNDEVTRSDKRKIADGSIIIAIVVLWVLVQETCGGVETRWRRQWKGVGKKYMGKWWFSTVLVSEVSNVISKNYVTFVYINVYNVLHVTMLTPCLFFALFFLNMTINFNVTININYNSKRVYNQRLVKNLVRFFVL